MVPSRRTILVGVAAGVLMTLAMAWIPPLVNPPSVSFPGLALEPGAVGKPVGTARNRWLDEPAWLATAGRYGAALKECPGCIEVSDMVYMPTTTTWHYVLASGWPFYAFHGGGLQMKPTVAIDDNRAPALFALPAGFPTRQRYPPSVPVAPLWAGLSLDLVFWTVVGVLAFQGFRVLRIYLRIRDGRCAACGYALSTESGRCSECGADRRNQDAAGPSVPLLLGRAAGTARNRVGQR